MAGNNIYVQGSYIDVHDNEVVNLNVDKAEVRLAAGTEQTEDTEKANQNEVVSRLTPIFFGNREDAQGFLASIRGMKPTQITERVNQLVAAGKISQLSRKRDLWTVLHDAGIYACTEANWNDQIR